MPLGMEIGVGPGDFVFDGHPATRPQKKKTNPPHRILIHVYCSQTAGLIKLPLGTKVNLGSGDVVLYGVAKKRHSPPVFGSCLLWPNGWIDEDAGWYRSRPRPRPHCIRRGPSSARKGNSCPPIFSAHVYCGHGRPSQLLLSSCYKFV